jgi:uncharacterized MAPEG superfamily protein
MTTELYWLTLTAVLTGLLWVPYIVNRILEHERGPLAAMQNPDPSPRPKAAWADRLMCAHANAVENLVIFATLVLVLHAANLSTAQTAQASCVYFFTRLAHPLFYTFRVPYLRTVSFIIGVGCQAILALTILGLI